jgi:hypothetical protein
LALRTGWDISSAKLRMVEPEDVTLADYPTVAMSLMPYSNPGEFKGEVVWVGEGTDDSDYVKAKVKGNLFSALATVKMPTGLL